MTTSQSKHVSDWPALETCSRPIKLKQDKKLTNEDVYGSSYKVR